jgi:hypothetical protein
MAYAYGCAVVDRYNLSDWYTCDEEGLDYLYSFVVEMVVEVFDAVVVVGGAADCCNESPMAVMIT